MTRANVQNGKKDDKLTLKLADGIPWKIYVYLIGPYKICRKGKEPLELKNVTRIDPVTGKILNNAMQQKNYDD